MFLVWDVFLINHHSVAANNLLPSAFKPPACSSPQFRWCPYIIGLHRVAQMTLLLKQMGNLPSAELRGVSLPS